MRLFFHFLTLYRLRWKSWLAQERFLLEPTEKNDFIADHWINKEYQFCRNHNDWFNFHKPTRPTPLRVVE